MARIALDLAVVLPSLAAAGQMQSYVQSSFAALRLVVDAWVADDKALDTNPLYTSGGPAAGPPSRWAGALLELCDSLERARATVPDAETLCKSHRTDVAVVRYVAQDRMGQLDHGSAVRVLGEITTSDSASHPALRHKVMTGQWVVGNG